MESTIAKQQLTISCLKIIKKFLRSFQFTSVLMDLYFLRRFYLKPKGWALSRALHRPVSREGEPLPWFTYASIFFLEPRISKDHKVFEFGSGHSTMYLSSKVADIVSVESEENFYKEMKPKLDSIENVEYLYKSADQGLFSASINGFERSFDIIVVDGADRVNCAKNAVLKLKDNGVIIWDNSDRSEYNEGYELLERNGFRRIDFNGHGPIGYLEWCTSIFYRSENCLGI
ncbi:MAG: FkbM family methyltransferase [Bacteroidota bacterium]